MPVKCICQKETDDPKGWNQVGAIWICPQCQENPQQMSEIIEDTKKMAAVIQKKQEEKAEVIMPVFKTSDNQVFDTEAEAKRHLLKIKKIRDFNNLINKPVHFTDIQLGIIIDKFDEIKKFIEG
jgi:mevalonate kinase